MPKDNTRVSYCCAFFFFAVQSDYPGDVETDLPCKGKRDWFNPVTLISIKNVI